MSNIDETQKLKGDIKIPFKVHLRRIFKYIKPEIKYFIFSLILLTISVATTLTFPLVMKFITEELCSITHQPSLVVIICLALGYLGLMVVGQLFLYFQSLIMQKSGQRVVYQIRMEVYEHILNMSLNQFNEMPVGSLVTRVANYTTAMSDLFTNIFINLLKNSFTVIIVLVLLLIESPALTAIQLSVVTIVFVVSFIFRGVVSKIFHKERSQISELNTFLNENLSGMKTIQIFNQEKRKEEEFLEKSDNLRKTRNKVMIAFALYRPFITFLYYVSVALTFLLGMNFNLSAGSVVEFYMLLSYFFNPIQAIADQLNGIQKAITASERLFNLLDVKPQVVDKPEAIEVENFKGKIEFRNVWFAYEEENWILKDVSFIVEPMQTVAFVGATGAGKTTILSLIVRNFEPQKGDIFIDDINIKNIKISSLRKAIGQMLQDVFLFTGTIKDNITLFDNSFSIDDINNATTYVNADSFISNLDKGLDEEVIEKGENFSQGQKQLISFARTVLHKPQILILDEATANIDTETEVIIQKSLDKIKNIGTMLIVAHRLSTIQKADNIIVLSKGELVEQGSHQQLLKKKGIYYRLYKLQFEEHC